MNQLVYWKIVSRNFYCKLISLLICLKKSKQSIREHVKKIYEKIVFCGFFLVKLALLIKGSGYTPSKE